MADLIYRTSEYQPPITSFELMMNPNHLNARQRGKSCGPYDSSFRSNLIRGGVYPPNYPHSNGKGIVSKPDNWDELQGFEQPRRPSLASTVFSEEEHARFVRADDNAASEQDVLRDVIPTIEGQVSDDLFRTGNTLFTNLDPLTDAHLSQAKPDIYYGARRERLDPRVLDKLNGQIISSRRDLPVAPNFFLEVKHPDASVFVAQNQAMHCGALGERGMNDLQSFAQNQRALNQAHTITSTYHSGQLKMYATHSTPTGPDGRREYHMTQINTWGMTGNPRTFRDGATAYRNARDWAEEQRNELIRQANERAEEGQEGKWADGG